MAAYSTKNVWGNCTRSVGGSIRNSFKPDDGRVAFGNFKADKKMDGSSKGECLAFGPFGSKISFGSSSGPTSLPAFGLKKMNSKIYQFELGSASSGSSASSSTKGSGSNSLLTFGMEPKKYNWGSNPFANTDQSLMEVSSGGSSRNSSSHGSNSRLDWGGMVETVFKEEIGKMAEGLQMQRGTCCRVN